MFCLLKNMRFLEVLLVVNICVPFSFYKHIRVMTDLNDFQMRSKWTNLIVQLSLKKNFLKYKT